MIPPAVSVSKLIVVATRIVIVGPPGSKGNVIALTLLDTMNDEGGKFECIVVGDLIKREISKRSEFGEKIEEALRI